MLLPALLLAACPLQDDPGSLPAAPSTWLTLERIDPRGRHPLLPDAVFGRHLLDPGSALPAAGEELEGDSGKASWTAVEPDAEGWVGGGPGWAHAVVESTRPRVAVARVTGASTFFVNGVGFAGDVYRYGWGGVPVALEEGANPVFVTGVRGAFRFELTEPPALAYVADFDATLPDAVAGEPLFSQAAFLVMHAGTGFLQDVELVVSGEGLVRTAVALDRALVPLEVTKLGVPLILKGSAGEAGSRVPFTVELSAGGEELHTRSFELVVRGPDEARRVTRWSPQDASVQRFAVLAPTEPVAEEGPAPGIVLSLHGASVDSLNQARSYGGYPDLWVVAPTNRRPYGFDWQDWGRLDAYETLAWVQQRAQTDPARTYLTGHSMGGHGAWHLAANDPSRWAAVAPSAGWESFDSYGGRPEGSWNGLWSDADAASRTRDLVDNLVQVPTYVLHGTADDNVPPSEAEAMLELLRGAGAEPQSHFEEGAGHWWDGHDEPGAQCLDWPGFRELFARTRVESSPVQIEFISVDPTVDPEHHWVEVLQARTSGRPLRVRGSVSGEGAEHRVVVVTENCRALVIRPPDPEATTTVEVDGDLLATPARAQRITLLHDGEQWTLAAPDPAEKRPGRTGPFKRAFDKSFVLVVGTQGDDRESAELLARARYDAGVWWYRGNGRAPILMDFDFLARERPPGTNVVLYGNRDSNAAWATLLPEASPLDALAGALSLGDERWEGDALGAVCVQPMRGDDNALVGVFASTGWRGARLGYGLKPFVSGVGYPDYAVFGPELTTQGDAAVRAAGWWGPGWTQAGGTAGERTTSTQPETGSAEE